MSRKKKHEHVNHERWLVSYADFITLLFAFFVVLFASGQADKKKQQRFASAMQQAFSQMALFEPHAKQPALNSGSGSNPDAEPKPLELPLDTGKPASLEQKVAKLVAQQTSPDGGMKLGELTARKVQDGVALSLHEGGFFASGSAELRPEAVTVLQQIATQLPAMSIRVEGHTDNLPMHSTMYASNWELSSARAATIARFLLEHSTVNPSLLSVAGYAEFHPVASNATTEGRAANRRVDVVFLESSPKQ
ncbi:MAG: flagellar motor protein MotB [Acidobacteriaceae bacterium]|nr:flagellar motor protein MotB [Acidobacteriaceae bacterium]